MTRFATSAKIPSSEIKPEESRAAGLLSTPAKSKPTFQIIYIITYITFSEISHPAFMQVHKHYWYFYYFVYNHLNKILVLWAVICSSL